MLSVERGKCVVLATHQHQYLNDCRCVLVSAGKVTCVGSYVECVEASGGQLKAHHTADDAVDSFTGDGSEEMSGTVADEDEADDKINEKDTVLQVEDNKEMSVQGLVSFGTYLNYMRAMGNIWVAIGLVLLFCVTQAALLLLIIYMGKWAEKSPVEQSDMDIVGLIIGIAAVLVILAIVRAFSSFRLTVTASQHLHDRMTEAVLRAKIEFFDTNPLGRIMNRFSADVGSNDDLLPTTLFDFSVIAFMVIGALITTVITLPFTLIAIPPLMVSCHHLFLCL